VLNFRHPRLDLECVYGAGPVDPVCSPSGTPLWFYVLREAEVQYHGEQLGEVGGRIVAEVLIELLRRDPGSLLFQVGWKQALHQKNDSLGMADLLSYAGQTVADTVV
jgi:hypothetical protein